MKLNVINLNDVRALQTQEIVPDMDVEKWAERAPELYEALEMCRKLTPLLAKLLPEPAFEEVHEAAEHLEGLVDLVTMEVAYVVEGAEDRTNGFF